MIDDLGGTTSQLVKLALDISVLRQKVIANNIANVNTKNYKPQSISFEEQLMTLEESRSTSKDYLLSRDIERIRQTLNTDQVIVSNGKNKVELDVETTKLAENVIRYKALLEGLSKRSSLIGMAINGQGG